jgi:hypothetical protein
MRSPLFITLSMCRTLILTFLIAVAVFTASAQRIAIVTAFDSPLERSVAAELSSTLSTKLRVQDLDMTSAAFLATRPADPFNMTAEGSRRLGEAVGVDLMIVLNAATRRRAAIEGADRFESFAVLYFVNSKSGQLANWKLISSNALIETDSKAELIKAVDASSEEIIKLAKVALADSSDPHSKNNFGEIPAPDSPDAKTFRSPVPYRRLKPEYTRSAYLYDVTATVEATVDLNEKGEITGLEISRWAGFGLDESVEAVIRSMNWRPAERNGKPLPVRFLVRYNFKKIEKDDNE